MSLTKDKLEPSLFETLKRHRIRVLNIADPCGVCSIDVIFALYDYDTYGSNHNKKLSRNEYRKIIKYTKSLLRNYGEQVV